MTKRAPVAFFITPHGFGHAARACALIAAMRRREPRLVAHLFTTVPRWFFVESLGAGFALHRHEIDVGLVQRGPLGEDLPATVARLRALYAPKAAAIASLARALHRSGSRLAVCDIAPLGILAAQAAGIPCVLVENFTWGWIYRGLASREPALAPFADLLDRFAARCDLRVQTDPVCVRVAGSPLVGPMSRRPRAGRAATRAALGVPSRSPAVLVTMGGVPHGGFALGPLREMPEVAFVLAGGARRRRREGNLLLLPHRSGFYHPDLALAADAIVGKIGYSTLAESCRARIPYGFVPREGFRESAVLARWLLARGRGVRIAPGSFASGAWVRSIPRLLALGRPAESFGDGAAEAATLIHDRLGM